MDLFELVGRIAVSGAEEANAAIDSVADNAEKNALRICGAIESIGTAALDYGLDLKLPTISVGENPTDFTDVISERVKKFFSGNEDDELSVSDNGIFDDAVLLIKRLEGLKPVEISNTDETVTTENYNSTSYDESYSESVRKENLLSRISRDFSNTSRKENYFESRSFAEIVEKIIETAELVNRNESLSESVFTTKNVTEISANSDMKNLSSNNLSAELVKMGKALKTGLPKISNIQLSELEKLYRKSSEKWEKIGLSASVGMNRMADAITEKIPLVRLASDAAAQSAQQALYVDGTASGGYLMDTFRNGISGKALEIYRSVSGIAQNISAIMSGITFASVSVEASAETQSIPEYATGGIVTREHIARVGEDGAEAIIPLEHNTEWIDKVASRMSGNTSNSVIAAKLDELILLMKNQKIYLDGRTLVGGIAGEMDRKLGSMARLKGRG